MKIILVLLYVIYSICSSAQLESEYIFKTEKLELQNEIHQLFLKYYNSRGDLNNQRLVLTFEIIPSDENHIDFVNIISFQNIPLSHEIQERIYKEITLDCEECGKRFGSKNTLYKFDYYDVYIKLNKEHCSIKCYGEYLDRTIEQIEKE